MLWCYRRWFDLLEPDDRTVDLITVGTPDGDQDLAVDPDDPAVLRVIAPVQPYGDTLADVGAVLAMCSVDDDG